MKNIEIPNRLTLSYSDANFKKFIHIYNNQYVKKKFGIFSSNFIKLKNEKIIEKSERYEDIPSKSSINEENNFNTPLSKINKDDLNLFEKNNVINIIKMLLNIVDKESLIDIKNKIDTFIKKINFKKIIYL